ncbi:DUF2079 domain-containing protein [Leptospira gomenensis]|uniref:DUF2079 domain-containing protein n=2 Tax=Leptospira gomenensis TaxID=2484974 RepID=A0A5F1Y6Z7_9LEPT|nr:DUF2079 domain-containing protein [Leptospira gomenensis]TGK29100.1 DUF2079 domain-containing protein [Leptospira gomenensis]TGK45053.1 DUF2079 domain-containing protein [Leptospira gomenensis]TGK51905.1 DUF2079 domain-containing protein [Leptospira gomenensis]TGK67385.1 DUF2079 domain-containing protein [Leptospira gomenensis]
MKTAGLLPFFILFLPIQFLILPGNERLPWIVVLLLVGYPLRLLVEKKFPGKFLKNARVLSYFFLVYWSCFIFGEGILYSKTALNSFLLGDLDYTAQERMLRASFSGDFFLTQYYGAGENANFLSHHMTPSALLLAPFSLVFPPNTSYAVASFFYASFTLPLLYCFLRDSGLSEDLSLSGTLLWAGSSSFYRLSHSLHFEILIPVAVLILYLGIRKRSFLLWTTGLAIYLGIKEDLSVYMAALSLGAVVYDRERKREWFYIFIICVFYFILLHPALRYLAGNTAERNWSDYWGTTFERPIQGVFQYVQNPENRARYWKGIRDLSLELGFWNWTGSWVILPFLGLYSVFRMSIHPWVRDLYSYYVYPLVPFLLLFVKTGAQTIERFVSGKEKPFLFLRDKETKRTVLIVCAFVLSSYRNSLDSAYPIRLSVRPDKVSQLESLLRLIPSGDEVSAGFHVSPFLPGNNETFPIREDRSWKKWIVFDRKYNSPYVSSEKILDRLKPDLQSGAVKLVADTEDFVLYCSENKANKSCEKSIR